MTNLLNNIIGDKRYKQFKQDVNELPKPYAQTLTALQNYIWNFAKDGAMMDVLEEILHMFRKYTRKRYLWSNWLAMIRWHLLKILWHNIQMNYGWSSTGRGCVNRLESRTALGINSFEQVAFFSQLHEFYTVQEISHIVSLIENFSRGYTDMQAIKISEPLWS